MTGTPDMNGRERSVMRAALNRDNRPSLRHPLRRLAGAPRVGWRRYRRRMTERVAWLGTTPLAALITVAIFLVVIALAVVLSIALLGGQNRR